MPVKETVREKLLSLRRNHANQVFTRKELIRRLQLEPEHRSLLSIVLDELEETGVVHRIKRGKYAFSPIGRTLVGKLEVHRDGFGFVRPEGKKQPDVYIHRRDISPAVHGDRVVISLADRSVDKIRPSPRQPTRRSARRRRSGEAENTERRRQGRVIQVLERANQRILGRVFIDGNSVFVQPLDERLRYEVHLPQANRELFPPGRIIEVDVLVQPTRLRPAVGRLRAIIGDPSDKDLAIKITLCKFGIPNTFPAAAVAEARSTQTEIGPHDLAARRDFRAWPTVTIDGETARDFDDAITLEKNDDGTFELGVHIADVSHYVRTDSALDAEAYLRGNSVYFPDRAVPMLPPELSSGICSLNPAVDRLVLSVLMRVSPDGRVLSYQIVPGVIRSDARMTYTGVARILADQECPERNRFANLVPMFERMHAISETLWKRRRLRGAIDLDLPEAEVRFDEHGQVADVVESERNPAHRIIEEFMLLANETIAGHLTRWRRPALYRIHEDPDPERIQEFKETIRLFGHQLTREGDRYTPRDFQRLSDQITGKPRDRVLFYLMLRSFMQARYSETNTGHFGLACAEYTHFTSPIRRYADLVVHRLVRKSITRDDITRDTVTRDTVTEPASERGWEEEMETLRKIAVQVSHRERVAVEAEREMVEHYSAELMHRHVGEVFDGVVISVVTAGLFVRLDRHYVEGYLPAAFLEDDYYIHREDIRALVGRRTQRMFRLGDVVRVVVDRVDLDGGRILFSLAE